MPSPPEHDGPYPEDQEGQDDETSVDSSLLINQVVARITSGVPEAVCDSRDEDDDGVYCFGHDDSRRLRTIQRTQRNMCQRTRAEFEPPLIT